MPDPIPSDDLYARLGVRRDDDAAAIDRAWRSLLKRHHPDVAGAVSLELAKLINVAHDWLSDADRRARYDEAIRRRDGRRSGPQVRPAHSGPTPRRSRRPAAAAGGSARADRDGLHEVFGVSASAVRSFFEQAAALTDDDIDRLSVSDPVDPVTDLRDLVPPELWARIDALDARVTGVLPPQVIRDIRAASSARGFGHALVLESFLWYYLADPEPLLEQMRRGWESAVGLPRYGPNTDEVWDLLRRLRRATPATATTIASAWTVLGDPQPWPPDAWEFDFAALEVSAALARHDAEAAAQLVPAPDDPTAGRWRAAFASTAHVVTLRPIFSARAYAQYERALGVFAGTRRGARGRAGDAPEPTVRRA